MLINILLADESSEMIHPACYLARRYFKQSLEQLPNHADYLFGCEINP